MLRNPAYATTIPPSFEERLACNFRIFKELAEDRISSARTLRTITVPPPWHRTLIVLNLCNETECKLYWMCMDCVKRYVGTKRAATRRAASYGRGTLAITARATPVSAGNPRKYKGVSIKRGPPVTPVFGWAGCAFSQRMQSGPTSTRCPFPS